MNLVDGQNSKNPKFVMDKIFHPLDVHFDTNSLAAWLNYYYTVHVRGSPEKTEQAKKLTCQNSSFSFKKKSAVMRLIVGRRR
jgi:hypothetical protein